MKTFLRRLVFPLSRYHAYRADDVGGYAGWYDFAGRCIAFKGVDGSMSFDW